MSFAERWAGLRAAKTHGPIVTATLRLGLPVGWLPADEQLLNQALGFLHSDDGANVREFGLEVAEIISNDLSLVHRPTLEHAPVLAGAGIALGALEGAAGQLREGMTWKRAHMALRLGGLQLSGEVESRFHDGQVPAGDAHAAGCGHPAMSAAGLCLTSGYVAFRRKQAQA